MDQQVNPRKMEKIVREAGLYEENMSKEEIETYYKAIANSKNTATTENESREFKKSLILLEEEPTTSNTISKPNDHTDDEITEEFLSLELDANKAIIDFNEMAKPKEECFPIIERPLKYVSIQNSKEFLDANVELKVKMLYSYHTKMAKLRSRLSRESFFPVPMPKPIIITNYDSDTGSRSGRQTKKKVCNKNENSLDAVYNKNQKNPFLKSNSMNNFKSKETAESLLKSIQTENIEKEITSVTSQSTTKARRGTNADILERSVLFADNSPKTNKQSKSITSEMFGKTTFKTTIKLPRGEEMFKNLKEEMEKKQKQENDIAFEFVKVTDEEIEVQNQQENEDIPVRKQTRKSAKKSSVSSRGSVEPSKMENANLACYINMKKEKSSKVDPLKNGVESTSSTTNVACEEQCPVCAKNFPIEQIEAHAASCGLIDETVPKYLSHKKLVCHICDQLFISNYDAHVQECINRQRQLDKKD